MEIFRTTFRIPDSPCKLDYTHGVLLTGSCFTENIGNRLGQYKFHTLTNPSGIIFNPVSISRSLHRITEGMPYEPDELLFHDGQWLSLEHHGSFSGPDASTMLKSINQALVEAHTFLAKSSLLIITLGTAWVYRYRESGEVVANCHKIPQNAFDKQVLGIDQILRDYRSLLQALKSFNPGLDVCFSLSPIRHWRDGAVENQRSKSILHAAIQQLVEEYEYCHYFPAYELLMDDLRDYRFYEADMIHPNAVAVEYIWERFRQSWIDASAYPLMEKVGKLVSAMQHRPHHENSEAYRRFAAQQLEASLALQDEHPQLDFSREIAFFRNKLG